MKRIVKMGLSALSLMALAVAAKTMTDADLQTAQNKAQETLRSIGSDTNTPVLPDTIENPGVSQVQGRVPVVPDYAAQAGTVATVDKVDPLVVAERARKDYELIDPSVMDSTKANLLVFVSFSMPEESLKRLAYETAKAGGTLLLRGFVNDNLKATVEASNKLTNLGAEVQIHPDLFKDFAVTQVPTFVLSKPGSTAQGCEGKTSCTDHLKLVGDASLRTVLDRMSRESNSTLANLAQASMNRLEGR